MNLINTAIAMAGISLVVVASPGPTSLLVATLARHSGIKAAAKHIAAILAGDAIFIALATTGATTAMTAHATAWALLKAFSGLYLLSTGLRIALAVYKGWSALTGDSTKVPSNEPAVTSSPRRTLVLHVTNPKAALLFATLVPGMLPPSLGSMWEAGLMLTTIMMVHLTVAAGVLYGYALVGQKVGYAGDARFAFAFDAAAAAVMIWLGATLLLEHDFPSFGEGDIA